MLFQFYLYKIEYYLNKELLIQFSNKIVILVKMKNTNNTNNAYNTNTIESFKANITEFFDGIRHNNARVIYTILLALVLCLKMIE